MTSEQSDARILELADALEARALADPAILGSMVGVVIGYAVDAIRRAPGEVAGDLLRYGPAIGEAAAFVLELAPAGPALLELLPTLPHHAGALPPAVYALDPAETA